MEISLSDTIRNSNTGFILSSAFIEDMNSTCENY